MRKAKVNGLKILTKADICLIGLLVVIAVGGIGLGMNRLASSGTGALTAQISVGGTIKQTVPLREGYRQEIQLKNGDHYNVIEIVNGKIHIRQADCPDQLCVRSGWIGIATQQIVCLPNRVVIKIVAAENDLDDIAR